MKKKYSVFLLFFVTVARYKNHNSTKFIRIIWQFFLNPIETIFYILFSSVRFHIFLNFLTTLDQNFLEVFFEFPKFLKKILKRFIEDNVLNLFRSRPNFFRHFIWFNIDVEHKKFSRSVFRVFYWIASMFIFNGRAIGYPYYVPVKLCLFSNLKS